MGSFVCLSLIKPSLGEVAKCLFSSEQNLRKNNDCFSDLAHDSLERNLLRDTDMRPAFRRVQLSSFLNNVTGLWQWQQEQRKSQVRILEHIVYDLAAKIENKVLLYCLRLVWQVEADVQVVVPILSKDRQDYQTLLCASLAWERPADRPDQDLRSQSYPGLPGPSTPPASILTNFEQKFFGYGNLLSKNCAQRENIHLTGRHCNHSISDYGIVYFKTICGRSASQHGGNLNNISFVIEGNGRTHIN